MEVKDQIERLGKEYGRLQERWVFNPTGKLHGIETGHETPVSYSEGQLI